MVGASAGLASLLGLIEPPSSSRPATLRADAALVLSGDVDYLRVRGAVGLYEVGAVRQILMTGAGIGGDDAASLKAIAVERGVPADVVLLETRSLSTRENLVFAAPIVRAQAWRRVALVTSASHMGRAERVARKALPEIEWVVAPVADAGSGLRRYRQRLLEWAKLAGYLVRGWI